MTRQFWTFWLSMGLGIIAPVLLLSWATPVERSSLDLVISPYGKLGLLVVHLLFAMPAALAISKTLPQIGCALHRYWISCCLYVSD
jgi:hypothetical protein